MFVEVGVIRVSVSVYVVCLHSAHHHHHSDEIEDEVEDVDVKNIKHNNSSSNGMCVPVCASVCV